MKTHLLFGLFFILFLPTLKAQTDFRFADSTAQWNVVYGNYWDCHTTMCFEWHTAIHKIKDDTVINGFYYQTIDGALFPGGSQGFIRKDSAQKVFLRTHRDTVEDLLYDFSKQAGDTFSISYFRFSSRRKLFCNVLSTDTVVLDKPRKRLIVKYGDLWASPWYAEEAWIEGIGSLQTYFLAPGSDFQISDNMINSMICFFEKNNTVYHDTVYKSCEIDTIWNAINEAGPTTAIKIHPNPSAGSYLTIQSETSFPAQTNFQLFDVTGRMILQKPLFDKGSRVELDGISKGLYLYSIAFGDKKISSGKLAVQ